MQSILDIIQPIKLLSGSHSDTAKTGQGCAMNVIAYLNGEDQITDNSPCVCVTVRRPLIWLNDYLRNSERQQLVPYLLRAMGSATDDEVVINERLRHVVIFANKMADVAKRSAAAKAANAADNAAAYAATYAAYAAAAATYATYATYAAAANAADYAAAAANAANAADASDASDASAAAAVGRAHRNEMKAITFKFLDAVLPKYETSAPEVFERAKALVAIAAIV